MDIQFIIVTVIILAASAYVGQMIWRKAKSAAKTSSSSCASDCGCDAKKATN